MYETERGIINLKNLFKPPIIPKSIVIIYENSLFELIEYVHDNGLHDLKYDRCEI